MTGVETLGAIGPIGVGGESVISRLGLAATISPATTGPGFADVLASGMRSMEEKLTTASDLVRRFAVDDSIPLHQVTFALEEARLAVELAMQVRTRLVESYRELMNMQL